MKKFTGLGRGLDARIDTSRVDTNGGSSISEIALSQIIANPDQPRRTFDEEALEELADSIREHGVISPITLRDNGDGTYEMQTFFIIDEEAASQARIRAFEQAMRESAAAQKHAEMVSDFIKEGFEVE